MGFNGNHMLFISYHYPPEGGTGLPGAMRSVKFIRHLDGFDMHVVTIHPDSYLSSTKANNNIQLPINGEVIHRTGVFDIFSVLLKARDLLKGMLGKNTTKSGADSNFNSVFVAPEEKGTTENKSIFQKIKDFVFDACYFPDQAGPWLLPAFWKGLSVIRKNDIQIIFATGMPWTGLIVGWLLHFATGKPLIADFRDPWIGNPFHKSKGWLIDFLSAFFEKKVVRGAALVTANTAPLREDFIHRYPDLPPSHFITLPNGYDESDFAHLDTTSATGPDELTLCHAGFLYGLRDPAPLLEAVRSLNEQAKASGQRVVFKQIGRFDLHYDLQTKFKDMTEDGSLVFLPECAYDECLSILSGSDILVNIQPGTKTQIPSKLYDYLALDKPILNLTPKDGALGQIVRKHGFGGLFDQRDHEEIVKYLKEMLSEKKTGQLQAGYQDREKFNIIAITDQLRTHILNLR